MTANGKRLRTIGILMARGGGNARVDADGRTDLDEAAGYGK